MMLKDNSGVGYRALQEVANQVTAKANGEDGLARVYTFFDTGTPRVKMSRCRSSAVSSARNRNSKAFSIVRDLTWPKSIRIPHASPFVTLRRAVGGATARPTGSLVS